MSRFPPPLPQSTASTKVGNCATRHESAAKATGGSEVKGGSTAPPERNSRPGGLIVRQAWMGSQSQGCCWWLGRDVAGCNRFWGRPPAVDADGCSRLGSNESSSLARMETYRGTGADQDDDGACGIGSRLWIVETGSMSVGHRNPFKSRAHLSRFEQNRFMSEATICGGPASGCREFCGFDISIFPQTRGRAQLTGNGISLPSYLCTFRS